MAESKASLETDVAADVRGELSIVEELPTLEMGTVSMLEVVATLGADSRCFPIQCKYTIWSCL